MLLDSLASVTFLEFQVLLSYSEKHKEFILYDPNIENSIVEGVVSRLEMLGL